MASLIRCCLCVVLGFIIALLALFLLAVSGYAYKAGVFVYRHGGNIELQSALSFAEHNAAYDSRLSLIVASVVLGILAAMGVFVCMCLALIEIKIEECFRCLCGCGRRGRPKFYTTPDEEEQA